MSSPPKYDIQIEVTAEYRANESDKQNQRFMFAYTVTMTNVGTIGVKLLSRHWIITDGDGHVEEVRGEGVVGEQPHLLPGENFRYQSGAILKTSLGSMTGSYQMVADDGTAFDAPIPPFVLSPPRVLH